ncbi:DUF3750 domain-containing protein [Thioflexithrix psekupsensis]|uniref:DUF3750 domain-containing protein n=1 Tax=Thioflexithrix psekupsensis TaxID=1570016 RepID=A0A251X8P9_9GAMM|nr:DUF3750 domain-containing protein [Thioflexithrix psekupsensis]OUD14154.1 hypothetical protein TPSD3_07415 [Thioflexithrix psekupsensis]
MKWFFYFLLGLWLLLAGPIGVLLFGDLDLASSWQSASQESAGIAPPPKENTEAIIQVYAARTWSWRGAFAVHTWISFKRSQEAFYHLSQVVGFLQHTTRDGKVLQHLTDTIPDPYWYGSPPELLAEIRGGQEVDLIIDRLENAIEQYPYPFEYRMWPGPNSNTFTAFVARQLPELKLDLPPTAIGKDFLEHGQWWGTAPSGTGKQLSLYGLLGIMVAVEEGIELNLLSLTVGIDPLDLAIKYPGIGRIGWR